MLVCRSGILSLAATWANAWRSSRIFPDSYSGLFLRGRLTDAAGQLR